MERTLDDHLAQHSAAVFWKQRRAGEVELLGRSCTWNLWGGDRRPKGKHRVIREPDLLYMRVLDREPDTGNRVLVRRAFKQDGAPPFRDGVQLKNQPASMLPGGITYVSGYGHGDDRRGERIDGFADLVVRATAHEPVQPEPKPGPNPHVVSPEALSDNLAEAAWQIAEVLLSRRRDEPGSGEPVAPPPGRRRKTVLAEMVGAELRRCGRSVKDDTVRQYNSPGIKEWERKNPGH